MALFETTTPAFLQPARSLGARWFAAGEMVELPDDVVAGAGLKPLDAAARLSKLRALLPPGMAPGQWRAPPAGQHMRTVELARSLGATGDITVAGAIVFIEAWVSAELSARGLTVAKFFSEQG